MFYTNYFYFLGHLCVYVSFDRKCRGRKKKINKRRKMVIYSIFKYSFVLFILNFLGLHTCHKYERVLLESALILALKWVDLHSWGNDTYSDTTKNVKTCKSTYTKKKLLNLSKLTFPFFLFIFLHLPLHSIVPQKQISLPNFNTPHFKAVLKMLLTSTLTYILLTCMYVECGWRKWRLKTNII